MFHTPVLLQEIIHSIPTHSKVIIDGTLGHAGHSIAIAQRFPQARIIGIDRDLNVLAKTQERIKDQNSIEIIHDSYANIIHVCKEQKITGVDYILLDIGVNMEHFKDTARGFSIHDKAPLDMRFDQEQKLTAADIINTYKSQQLSEIFQKYADFTKDKADEIARHIDQQRKKHKIQDTQTLRTTLAECGLGKNAAAVIFQAIRIQTNQELKQLEDFLQVYDQILNPKGRLAVISYHSIEDRIVKEHCKQALATGQYIAINKKTISPTRQEVQHNRAARSAKLRILEKV